VEDLANIQTIIPISIAPTQHIQYYQNSLDTINMKFSIVSTALLAQGIVAMPWSSQKGIKANGDEIT
jgi:hypothetical protein